MLTQNLIYIFLFVCLFLQKMIPCHTYCVTMAWLFSLNIIVIFCLTTLIVLSLFLFFIWEKDKETDRGTLDRVWSFCDPLPRLSDQDNRLCPSQYMIQIRASHMVPISHSRTQTPAPPWLGLFLKQTYFLSSFRFTTKLSRKQRFASYLLLSYTLGHFIFFRERFLL